MYVGFIWLLFIQKILKKTLCEMVSDGNYGDETVTLSSQISIQEDEGVFIILVDNRYEICVKKIKLVIVD